MPLASAIPACSWVLCGTSWRSALELEAIQLARASGRRSVMFLDHWVNYAERFTRGKVAHWPDEIWVGDAAARDMASRTLPEGLLVRLVANPYFADVRDELARCTARPPEGIGVSVLYVAEPLSAYALTHHGDERHYGYTENDALRYFLKNIGVLRAPVGRLRIRRHPSEPAGKYRWAQQEFGLPIETDVATTQVEDVAGCDVVVGCESMALVVGLLAGKRVISCVPPGGLPCRLPQREMRSLAESRSRQTHQNLRPRAIPPCSSHDVQRSRA